MAVGSISVTLKGSIGSSPATCNGVGTSGSSGPTFRLALPASATSATNDEGATSRTVSSPAAFEDLGLPPNLRATVFYLSVQTLSPFDVELTYETTGLVIRPVAGSGGLILETPPADDRISLVRVRGEGTVEWYAAGGIV